MTADYLLLASTMPDDLWSLLIDHERQPSNHVSMPRLLPSLDGSSAFQGLRTRLRAGSDVRHAIAVYTTAEVGTRATTISLAFDASKTVLLPDTCQTSLLSCISLQASHARLLRQQANNSNSNSKSQQQLSKPPTHHTHGCVRSHDHLSHVAAGTPLTRPSLTSIPASLCDCARSGHLPRVTLSNRTTLHVI